MSGAEFFYIQYSGLLSSIDVWLSGAVNKNVGTSPNSCSGTSHIIYHVSIVKQEDTSRNPRAGTDVMASEMAKHATQMG